MTDADDLWAFERRFWLEGSATYERHLATDARLVFPLPTGVLDRAAMLDALRDAPRWRAVRFVLPYVIALGADAALLVYAVEAVHDAEPVGDEGVGRGDGEQGFLSRVGHGGARKCPLTLPQEACSADHPIGSATGNRKLALDRVSARCSRSSAATTRPSPVSFTRTTPPPNVRSE